MVITDGFRATVPQEEGPRLYAGVTEVLDQAGFWLDYDAGEKGVRLHRPPDGLGAVRFSRAGQVAVCSVSGSACAHLRALDLFLDVLAGLSDLPHRVTRLDAALDLDVDAADVLPPLYDLARLGGVRLSRKAIKPSKVQWLRKPDSRGIDTGTVYLGDRGMECYGAVYDKREDRLRRGLVDLGPMTRYEIRGTGQLGISLRDVAEPAAFFYHFASPDLVPLPEGQEPWEPGGQGFVLSRERRITDFQRLKLRIENSRDLRALFDLAIAVSPMPQMAHHVLFSLLGKAWESRYGAESLARPPGLRADVEPFPSASGMKPSP